MAATWTSGVLDLFVELAAIPSPSGEEEPVAAVIRSYLADLGLAVEDDEAGNLLARLEPEDRNGGRSIFLCAHMDTVPPVGGIEPVVGEDGFVRNGAGTILGADNKATVAVLLAAARLLLSEGRPHAGVELLFTVKEEVGLQGAKEFDQTRLVSKLGFVYDCSGPIGGIVRERPPLEEVPQLEVLQLDLGGFAVVAGEKRQVEVVLIVDGFEQLARAGHQAFVAGARVFDLFGEERNVARAEAIVLLGRVGQAGCLERLRHQVRIGPSAKRLTGKCVGDAKGLIERPCHGAQAGAAA